MRLDLRKGEKWLFGIVFVALIGFTIFYLRIANYEFLWYIGVMVFFLALVLVTLRRTNFDYLTLGGLSLWGLMHLAGGGVIVNGNVLYALPLIPLLGNGDSLILKFDQLVHFIGFGTSTLVAYHLIKPYLGSVVNYKVLYVLVVLMGMGVGAFNEIVEYFATLVFSETGVGGYDNTMIDIIFNTLGAITAVFIIHYKRIRNEYR